MARMNINGIELNISMAAFDGCHKIYIPTEGQEDLFIKSQLDNGYIWEEDFFKIESAEDLLKIYLSSCPMRFIEQIDCSGDENKFTTIIPQCAFLDEYDFFDEELAKAAFTTL